LAEVTISLAGTLSQTSLYDLNHPSAREAIANMHRQLMRALQSRSEITYVTVQTSAGEDLLIEGYFDEPRRLMRVLPAGMAALHVPRLLRYFERHRLFSLTLLKRLDHDELSSVVEVLVAAAAGRVQNLATELTRKRIENVRLVLNSELIVTDRELPWRTKLAMTRLLKNLARLALNERLPASKRDRLRDQLIDDVLRPIRTPPVISNILLNLDLVDQRLRDHGLADPPRTLIARLSPALCADVVSALFNSHTLDEEQRARAVALTRVLLDSIEDEESPELVDVLEQLVQASELSPRDLPERLRSRLAKRLKARKVLGQSEERLALLAGGELNENLHEATRHLDTYRELSHELLRLGGTRFLAEVSIALRSLQLDPAAPHRLRALAPETLRATALPPLLDTLIGIYADSTVDREKRFKALDVLQILGPRGIASLVELLCTSEDRWVRRTAMDALSRAGHEVEPHLLKHLGRPTPWYVTRNMLLLLEQVGTSRSATAVSCMLEHTEARVRALATKVFARLGGPQSEDRLLRLLADQDEHVRVAAVEQLGLMKCTHLALGKLYAEVFDQSATKRHSEKLRNAACVALARTGNFSIEGSGDAEQILAVAVATPTSRLLSLVKLKRRSVFALQERQLMCKVLGQIGGQHAIAVLEELVNTDPEISSEAAQALEELKGRQGQ